MAMLYAMAITWLGLALGRWMKKDATMIDKRRLPILVLRCDRTAGFTFRPRSPRSRRQPRCLRRGQRRSL